MQKKSDGGKKREEKKGGAGTAKGTGGGEMGLEAVEDGEEEGSLENGSTSYVLLYSLSLSFSSPLLRRYLTEQLLTSLFPFLVGFQSGHTGLTSQLDLARISREYHARRATKSAQERAAFELSAGRPFVEVIEEVEEGFREVEKRM